MLLSALSSGRQSITLASLCSSKPTRMMSPRTCKCARCYRLSSRSAQPPAQRGRANDTAEWQVQEALAVLLQLHLGELQDTANLWIGGEEAWIGAELGAGVEPRGVERLLERHAASEPQV